MASRKCLQRVKLKAFMEQSRYGGTSTRSLSIIYKPPNYQHVLDQRSHADTFMASMSYQNMVQALELKGHRPFSTSSLANNVADNITEKNSDAVDALRDESNFLVTEYGQMAKEANVMLDEHQIVALTELDRLRNDILSSNVYTNENKTNDTQSSIGDNEEDEPFFPFMKKMSS